MVLYSKQETKPERPPVRREKGAGVSKPKTGK